MLAALITFTTQAVIPPTLNWLWFLAPIWIPLILWEFAWDLWVRYIRIAWILSVPKTLVEIRLPQETMKSPAAMELVLNAIHNTADGSNFAQYWKGEMRPQYSLELISLAGQVKFLIWLEARRMDGLMSALYSQFPGVGVHEVPDYTKDVFFDPEKLKVFACEMMFTKDNAYPIKTYVDFGLDKDPKEEFKVDPMTPMLEWLGSVKADQQVWIQMIVRAHKKDQIKPNHLFKKTDLWKDGAEKLINEIMKRNPKTKVTGEEDEETGMSKKPTMSPADNDLLDALSRSITKPAFDVGIRAIYISPRATFDTPFGIGGIISSFKHFNTEHLNGFKPNGDKWMAQFGDPWKDYKNIRRNALSSEVLVAYKQRAYFHPPFMSQPLVLNTEELATIYHFPGSVSATPGLQRIPSKRADAPTNLPI
ncbi:MAG TPA: hypothetical protein VMR73_00115 [Candidatus Paceibacterota bacterium]|nr:hypothetical protein [Candidatus Paceibacterota bacterium]